jgi:type II secretory pathway component PulF
MNGLLVTGVTEGDTDQAVRRDLADRGLIPIAVVSGTQAWGDSSWHPKQWFKSVTREELLLFTRQFHSLFKAGMDMETLLKTLSKQVKNEHFREIILRINSDVASGSSLSRAFGQHPRVFNELYIHLLETGEEAGILEKSLEQLALVIEKEATLKSQIKSATLYPKIVFTTLIGAGTVMLTYVVPKFSSFYDNFNAELPMITRFLLATSDILVTYGWLFLLLMPAVIMLIMHVLKKPSGRMLWDRWQWRIPIFGPLSQKVANARFTNLMASLYKAGMPVTRSLEITSRTIEHSLFSKEIMHMKSDVEKGRGLADAMRMRHYFHPILTEATAIGERSGSLDDMYFSLAEHFEKEINFTLKNLTTLLEPILLFLVFGMVTVFALAIFMPMWGMSKAALG